MMKTITFYSYKGGAGRSLALANAARYLARLGFKVIALDFDLEAPGLHYKFSEHPTGSPLAVTLGLVDYLHSFIVEGWANSALKDYTVDVSVPGIEKPLIQLIPAGRVPSKEYWAKLSGINWHQLFYSNDAKGVQVFLELKSRISEELKPDYLLVDSRTGITEMGGVATTLLADKVICLVLPTLENLEGARAVLRSLKRFRRDVGALDADVTLALSRLPQMKGPEDERGVTESIRAVMNEEAEDLKDTLSCQQVFVLHSETNLQLRESLRVGSGITPDDSILLRDYLRLFASVVPNESIEPKVHDLIERAKQRIWDDPDAAVKEVEELAESFGHPENYRALLRFYEVRNVSGSAVLKRAQRLWELTGDSGDPVLLQAVNKHFDPRPRWKRTEREWSPNLEFIKAVWRDGGNRNPELGAKIADAYEFEDRESQAADVLLDIIANSEATADLVGRSVRLLDNSRRYPDAKALLQRFKPKLVEDPGFVEAWANHVLTSDDKEDIKDLVSTIEQVRNIPSALAARIYLRAGLVDSAAAMADAVLSELAERRFDEQTLVDISELFTKLQRWDEFEAVIRNGRYPPGIISELKERSRSRRRAGRL